MKTILIALLLNLAGPAAAQYYGLSPSTAGVRLQVVGAVDVYQSSYTTGGPNIVLHGPYKRITVRDGAQVATMTAAGFYGSGSGLTSLPAAQLTGVVPAVSVNLSTVTSALANKLDTNGSAANLTNFPTLNQNTTGNAATATKLATARTINGVSFDGTADINIAATSYLADGVSLALTGATFSAKSSSVTLQGNTFNGASQLVKLDALSKLPAVDGSQLTNLPSTSGGAVLAATQTFTGANTFTGSITSSGNNNWTGTNSFSGDIYSNSLKAFIPFYVIEPTTYVGMSTQTWAVNLSTGVYELDIVGAATADLKYRFNSDSGAVYYGSGYFSNLAGPGHFSYSAATEGRLLYADSVKANFHGVIEVGGAANAVGIIADTLYDSAASRHFWGLNYVGSGYPTTISIFTAGTFTGRVSLRKVSN